MGDSQELFLPIINNNQIEMLNQALKQVIKEMKQMNANVIVTTIEDCILYSLEVEGIEVDIKKLDFICDSLTTKILGIKSKKCFTNVIGKRKDCLDILSYREMYIE